jgi:hypothetical protein
MATSVLLRRVRPSSIPFRPVAVLAGRRRYSSAMETVPLVYDLHEPAKPTVPDEKTSPILFMHGLFGSKKNNRSISK